MFIVHGDDKVTENFAAHVHEVYGYDTYAPYSGDTFDLVTGEQIADGSREMIEKKKMDHQKLPATYLQDFLRQDRGCLRLLISARVCRTRNWQNLQIRLMHYVINGRDNIIG